MMISQPKCSARTQLTLLLEIAGQSELLNRLQAACDSYGRSRGDCASRTVVRFETTQLAVQRFRNKFSIGSFGLHILPVEGLRVCSKVEDLDSFHVLIRRTWELCFPIIRAVRSLRLQVFHYFSQISGPSCSSSELSLTQSKRNFVWDSLQSLSRKSIAIVCWLRSGKCAANEPRGPLTAFRLTIIKTAPDRSRRLHILAAPVYRVRNINTDLTD